jgi:hypothetical protein
MDFAEHETTSLTTYAVVADAKQLGIPQTATVLWIGVETIKKIEAKVLDVIFVESTLLKGFKNNVVGSLATLNIDHRGATAVEDDPNQSLVGRQSTAVCGKVVDAGA